MQAGYNSEKLIEEYQSAVEPAFRAYVEEHTEEKKNSYLRKLEKTLGIAETGDLKKVIDNLEQFLLQERPTSWIEGMERSLGDIPALVLLDQDESHFTSEEEDGAFITLAKTGKRMKRALGKAGVSIQNGVRRALKKEEKTWTFPKREVPFRNQVESTLLSLDEILGGVESFLSAYHARAYDEVYRWCVHQSSGEEEGETDDYEKDLTQILEELAVNFSEGFEHYEMAIEENLTICRDTLIKEITIAGTIELPASDFDDHKLNKRKEDFTKRLDEISEEWQHCTLKLQERSQTLLNTVKFKESLRAEETAKGKFIAEFFSGIEQGPHQELKHKVETATADLKEKGDIPLKELEGVCDAISSEVKAHIQENIVSRLTEAADDSRLTKALTEYVEEVMLLPATQPEKAVLIEHLDLTGNRPQFKSIEVDWQRIIRQMLSDYIANEDVASKIAPESYLKEILASYQEVAQIVETNLDMIEEVTSEEELTADEVAIQGLERALLKIEETEESLQMAREEINEKLISRNTKLLAELIGFLNKDDYGDVKWIQTQLKVRESTGGWKTRITVYWARLVDRLDLMRRFLMIKYRGWSDQVKVFLGKEVEGSLSTEKINLATFLYETDQKFNDLPFIYRRLFDFYRDIERNFYITDPVHFDQTQKAYDLFKDGFPASVVIVGEKGSGKSTLNRFLQDETFEEEPYRLSLNTTLWEEEELLNEVAGLLKLDNVISREDLIDQIRSKRKGSVVVIENIQNCFVRAMSGYSAIKTLLSVIAETREEVFWLLSSSRYAWNFLQVYLKIGEHFSHSIPTDELNPEEIRTLILKRQKASGYQLRFLPDADTEKSRVFKKFLDDDEAQQEYLQQKYFEKLTSMAEGNATVAMIYWIRSIVEFKDNEVTLQNLKITGTELLSSLESNSLFALSSFVLHDSLTPGQLAISMHCPESEAQMIISRLNTSGLLVKKKGYYSLNLLIYRQVVRVLKNKNILH